jgi:hypothetical protein
MTLDQAMSRPDWQNWKATIETEYSSLQKHVVFGELTPNLEKPPIGHKFIFIRKLDANGNILRYKVKLITQGFTRRPGIDYDQTYSPVTDTIF